jgi:hypothetical protein
MSNNGVFEDCGNQAVRSAQGDDVSTRLQAACHGLAVGAINAVSKAQDGIELECKGLLPHIKLGDFPGPNDFGNELTNEKNAACLIKGLLLDNPKMVVKAAEALPDGSYPIGEWIAKVENTGLFKLDPKDAELINALQTLTKHGDHFDITLQNPIVEGSGSHKLDLHQRISFDVVAGENPMINHIHGITHSVGVTSVDLDAVRAAKDASGKYDYQVHSPGIEIGPFHLGKGWKPI